MSAKLLPSFLDGITITQEEDKTIQEKISNWMKAYDNVYNGNASEEDIKKMLYVEMHSKCRLDLITRLKRRHDKLRKNREELEILECAKTTLSRLS